MDTNHTNSSDNWTINSQSDKKSLQEPINVNEGMTAASASSKPETTEVDEKSLAEKPGAEYNINDQAHSQSSTSDFIKTVSNFEHADGSTPPAALDSQHLKRSE